MVSSEEIVCPFPDKAGRRPTVDFIRLIQPLLGFLPPSI